jgi:C4-dicarboxylate-specific signal transduction histidine kinase
MTGHGVQTAAAPEFIATDVNDIVHAVVGSGRSCLPGKTVLTLEMCCELQRIRGNQECLTDVLHALLLRAERSIANADQPTGTIRIRTWATDADVRLSLLINGADVSIGDTVATGLGLSLTECAKIISDQGGRMYAWRPYAGEASYTIVLPVTSSPT